MAGVIVPGDLKDPNIPLFKAFGLTPRESDDVYFRVADLLDSHKTVAEALLIIEQSTELSLKQKVWGAYNLQAEVIVRRSMLGKEITRKILMGTQNI